jgi:hypothetical protein
VVVHACLAVGAWLLCAALTASAATLPPPRTLLLELRPELGDSCQCDAHRPASFASQMAGAGSLDDLIAAGATLHPVITSYDAPTLTSRLAAIHADLDLHHTDADRERYAGTDEDHDALWMRLVRSYVLTVSPTTADEDVPGIATLLQQNPAVASATVDQGGELLGWYASKLCRTTRSWPGVR